MRVGQLGELSGAERTTDRDQIGDQFDRRWGRDADRGSSGARRRRSASPCVPVPERVRSTRAVDRHRGDPLRSSRGLQSSHVHDVTASWRESTPGSRSAATSTSKPVGSASLRRTGRVSRSTSVGSDLSLQLDVDVFGNRLGAGRERQAEADLGSGREPLGERHGQAGPAKRAFPHPGRVAVAGEPHLADLGGAYAELHEPTPAGSRRVGISVTGTSPPRDRS